MASLLINLATGSYTLTSNDIQTYDELFVTGVSVTGRHLIWPVGIAKADMIVVADPTNAANFRLVSGGVSALIEPSNIYFVRSGATFSAKLLGLPPIGTTVLPGIVRFANITEARDGLSADIAIPPNGLGPFSAFRANKNGVVQTPIPNATNTVVTFTNEVFDIGAHYDVATSRWTPPAGLIMLALSIRLEITNTVDQKRFAVSLRKNGTTVIGGGGTIAFSGTAEKQGSRAFSLDQANGTDYYEAIVAHFVGAAVDLSVDGDIGLTSFSGCMVR